MTTYTIWPMRFSRAPATGRDFFGTLGLHPVVSEAPGGTTFVGRSGRLGVHDVHGGHGTAAGAVPGRTVLNLATDDLAAEQSAVTSPAGLVIGFTALEPGDRGGDGDLHDQTVAASMDVVAICSVTDVEREAEFFGSFGFRALEPGEGYLPLTAGPRSGVIALRATDDPPGSPGTVHLGVETSEPFDAFAARLQSAGYPATTVEDGSGVWIRVIDPDGQALEIRPTR